MACATKWLHRPRPNIRKKVSLARDQTTDQQRKTTGHERQLMLIKRKSTGHERQLMLMTRLSTLAALYGRIAKTHEAFKTRGNPDVIEPERP